MRETKEFWRHTAEDMVRFFETYDTAEGVPSFEKYAGVSGIDTERLRRRRADDPDFACAARRCLDILRDRLTDGALLRRFDPSFCKYALDALDRAGDSGGCADGTPFEVEVKIV